MIFGAPSWSAADKPKSSRSPIKEGVIKIGSLSAQMGIHTPGLTYRNTPLMDSVAGARGASNGSVSADLSVILCNQKSTITRKPSTS